MTEHGAEETLVTTAGSSRATVGLARWALAAGRPVVLSDGSRTDLVLAGHDASTSQVGFVIRHTSGFLTVAMSSEDCDRLDLPPMVSGRSDARGPDQCVSVDAARGITTGISAADRARTISLLANPSSRPGDLCRPGHVVPFRAHPDGVLGRPALAEAAVDLARAAGLVPTVAAATLVSTARSTELADADEGRAFARAHGLVFLEVADVLECRTAGAPALVRGDSAPLPGAGRGRRSVGYRSARGAEQHLALVCGDVRGRTDVPVYVHLECVAGDVFGSAACDCRVGLDAALTSIGDHGVIVYVRPASGPGDCQLSSDRLADAQAATVAVHVLRDLGVRTARPVLGSRGQTGLLALGSARAERPDRSWELADARGSGLRLAASAGSDYWGVG